jgi:hypothetical protein
MGGLTAFGLFAVTAMLVCYALEDHRHWFVLAPPEHARSVRPVGSSRVHGRSEW